MKVSVNKGLRKAGRRTKAIIQGDAVDSRFFKRHFFETAFAVITCMYFIAARIEHDIAARDIRQLENDIEVENTRLQKEVSRYHTLTRETEMRRLIDSLHLGLDVPEANPHERRGTLRPDD